MRLSPGAQSAVMGQRLLHSDAGLGDVVAVAGVWVPVGSKRTSSRRLALADPASVNKPPRLSLPSLLAAPASLPSLHPIPPALVARWSVLTKLPVLGRRMSVQPPLVG